jgi:putative spermidine/putrescine transport system permease protein
MIAGRAERILLSSTSVVLLIFVLAPTLMIVAASLNSSATLTFPPRGITLEWYRGAFATLLSGDFDGARNSLAVSFAVALVSAVLATLTGVMAAYALVRFRFPGRRVLEVLVSLPLVFPAVSFGIGLLMLVSSLDLALPYGRLILADTIMALPFVVRNVTASLAGLGRSVEEAAWMLGANKLTAFFKVTLPLARPGILSGLFLAFIVAFNEFTVSFFLYTPEAQPFSVWVFQRTEAAFDTTLTAIGTLVLAFNLVLLLAVQTFGRRRGTAFPGTTRNRVESHVRCRCR